MSCIYVSYRPATNLCSRAAPVTVEFCVLFHRTEWSFPLSLSPKFWAIISDNYDAIVIFGLCQCLVSIAYRPSFLIETVLAINLCHLHWSANILVDCLKFNQPTITLIHFECVPLICQTHRDLTNRFCVKNQCYCQRCCEIAPNFVGKFINETDLNLPNPTASKCDCDRLASLA